ncbi:MAG: hypothetical protein WBP93_17370 [Pyrinomonadaceae bacterium]
MLKQLSGLRARSVETMAIAAISLLLCFSGRVAAQETNIARVAEPTQIVTATPTRERVRFSAPNTMVQMRLEVYDEIGRKVFDTEQRGGSVLDWHLKSGEGERLSEGTYLCVVTVKSLSGRLSQKLGKTSVSAEQVSIQAVGATELNATQTQAIGPVERNSSLVILQPDEPQAATVIAHDGKDGQVTRTRGALTFRVGDFFSGIDQEQMRLSEEGNLGLGTAEPQAKLDVAGDIRSTGSLRVDKGIEFSDGTVQTSGLSGRKDKDGNIVPSASGSGTLNKIAKWTDNSGTLGDSVMTEASGNIGIGNSSPASLMHIGSFGGYGATTGLLLGNNLLGTQFDRALQVSPVQTANPAFNSILIYTLPTINSGVTVPKQYGFFIDAKQGNGTVTSYAALATGQVASLGATNNTHLLMGQLQIPAGNYGIYDGTGYRNYFSGNVGIGTNAPTYKLHVVGQDVRVEGTPGIFPRFSLNFTGGNADERRWQNYASPNALNFSSLNDAENFETIWLQVNRGPGTQISNVVLPTGNVGIGLFNPTAKLAVAGTVQSTSGGFKFPDGSVQSTAANLTYTTIIGGGYEVAPQSASPASLGHLNLPTGLYQLFFNTRFDNGATSVGGNNSRTVQCRFSGDFFYEISLADGSHQTLTLHAVLNITSGRVDVECRATNGDATNSSVFVWGGRLTAVKIESVIVQ